MLDKIPTRGIGVAPMMSIAQERIWLLCQLDGAHVGSHKIMAVHWHGKLDDWILGRCLEIIFERHEALRSAFPLSDACEPVLHHFAAGFRGVMSYRNVSSYPCPRSRLLEKLAEEGPPQCDLTQGYLVEAHINDLGNKHHVFLITYHRIAADDRSIQCLLRELFILYDDFIHGRPSSLPPLDIQYADYAAWQRDRNRTDPDAMQHIGRCENTVPLRLDLSNAPTAQAFMQSVERGVMESIAHQALPATAIQQLAESMGRPVGVPLAIAGCHFHRDNPIVASRAVSVERRHIDLPGGLLPDPVRLTLDISAVNDDVVCTLHYPSQMKRATAARYHRLLGQVLRAILAAPDQPVSAITFH